MLANRRPGWWYPYIFVAGFAVVLVVNFTMAYLANSTFSGMATQQPYEKGLEYNHALDDARRQDALGWTVESRVEPAADHGLSVEVSYRDRDGRPVDGLSVRAEMVRPTAKGHDRVVDLGPVSPGVYATHQVLPLAGQWDLAVTATGPMGTYGLSRRVLVP